MPLEDEEERVVMRTIYEDLQNKLITILHDAGNGQTATQTGVLTHGNDSFLVIKNREGKVRFISTKIVLKIKELE